MPTTSFRFRKLKPRDVVYQRNSKQPFSKLLVRMERSQGRSFLQLLLKGLWLRLENTLQEPESKLLLPKKPKESSRNASQMMTTTTQSHGLRLVLVEPQRDMKLDFLKLLEKMKNCLKQNSQPSSSNRCQEAEDEMITQASISKTS